jgi:site-specific recombinase XerD
MANSSQAKAWLIMGANLQQAQNTVDAYGQGVEDFFSFCDRQGIEAETATKGNIAEWINDLAARPNSRSAGRVVTGSPAGLSKATIQQKITAVRLFFDYLMEEGLRLNNPVGRGHYSPGKRIGIDSKRGIFSVPKKLPWIPNEDQWLLLLRTINSEPLRNKLMFALAYDSALRREELCSLEVDDLDPIRRTLQVRAEVSKTKRSRMVIYSRNTASLLSSYLATRPPAREDTRRLFLSESRRNHNSPISSWTWTKAVEAIAKRSGIVKLTTHTLRHLRLTDLARDGLDLKDIAEFAGHQSLTTTRIYIHLSGREWTDKFQEAMDSIHTWREIKLKG